MLRWQKRPNGLPPTPGKAPPSKAGYAPVERWRLFRGGEVRVFRFFHDLNEAPDRPTVRPRLPRRIRREKRSKAA